MWPIQLAYLRFILCRLLRSSLTLYCTPLFTRLVQLTFPVARRILALKSKRFSGLYQPYKKKQIFLSSVALTKGRASIFLQHHRVELLVGTYESSFVENLGESGRKVAETYRLIRFSLRGFMPTHPCMTQCVIKNRKKFQISFHPVKLLSSILMQHMILSFYKLHWQGREIRNTSKAGERKEAKFLLVMQKQCNVKRGENN
jgi:hypothetical protein